jgi:hypothetical protein
MKEECSDMATHQLPLTVITEIEPGKTEQLRGTLRNLPSPEDAHGCPAGPFARVPTVHFARWVVLAEAHDACGKALPPRLVLATEYDADELDDPEGGHLEQLVAEIGAELDAVYQHCVGYPGGAARASGAAVQYLRRNIERSNLFYVGALYRSVGQIREEDELRQAIRSARTRQDLVDALRMLARGRLGDQRIQGVSRSMMQRLIDRSSGLDWARKSPTLPERPAVIFQAIQAAEHRLEKLVRTIRSIVQGSPGQEAHRTALPGSPEAFAQNAFAHVVNVKPGRLRRWLLKSVLRVMALRVHYQYNRQGNLAGIESIHFARWLLIDDDRRLLFLSYYDANWDLYMDTFVDTNAAMGINSVWSHTIGFPATRFFVFRGCRDRGRFKNWVKAGELNTEYRYSGYPNLSIRNVNSNTKRRDGLCMKAMTREQAQAWRQLPL